MKVSMLQKSREREELYCPQQFSLLRISDDLMSPIIDTLYLEAMKSR